MDLELNGRVAVVTGASKGIGLAIARTLLEEGAHVVVASRTAPDLDGALHVPVDLMGPDAPAEVVARAVETYGGLDVRVNNAGGPPPGAELPRFGFLDLSDEDWLAMLEFNLLSAVRACRAALPLLLERGGTIVNVVSSVARQPASMNLDYCAAKAALLNLSKALSEEFGPRGVRVNSVSPGPTLTPWWTDAGGAADIVAGWTGNDPEQVVATVAPELMQLTTGRFVQPQEIADAVAYLASPRSASTTGTDLVVDGGLLKTA
jgi:NAD(P)-dependent dehydrogenase (short-subunit alcohol dehydrogenase family)